MIHGLDLASPQGSVPPELFIKLFAEGKRFLMQKCGDGNDAPDPTFLWNTRHGRDVGFAVGVYGVGFPLPVVAAHPDRAPDVQARMHFDASGGLGSGGGELPPALDLEWPVPGTDDWTKYPGLSGLSVREWALSYLETMSKLCGRPCALYSFPSFWRAIGADKEPAFAKYPLWWADYPAVPRNTYPTDASALDVPKPWSPGAGAVLWQFGGGNILLPNGEPADGDVFLGDDAAFQRYLTLPSN